jgi:hypothetical protein
MPKPIPKLSLTHGQVAWALSLGTQPTKTTMDQIRYLRQLGIPFEQSELGTGRGNALRYDFAHFIELGVAFFGLRRGVRPRDVADYVIGNRKYLRDRYKRAFLDQPESALTQPWVRSRGAQVPGLVNEIFLRLHDRHAQEPGEIATPEQGEVENLRDMLGMVERYPGEKTRTLLPLTRLVLELVAWAQEAPEIKPGP